jgi:addiction module HigA family antidote
MIMHNPPHPGDVLREFMGASSVTELAEHLGVSRVTLSRLLNGSAGVSAEMSLKLAEAFGTSPDVWLKMQVAYDLWLASRVKRRKVVRFVVRQAEEARSA